MVLCDGCSSSEQSEIGAMILALAAQKTIKKDYSVRKIPDTPEQPLWRPDYLELGMSVIYKASAMSDFLGIHETALDATLMIALYINGFVYVNVYGDGFVIAKKRHGGLLSITEVAFETDSPYYLSYWLNKERERKYHKEMDKPKIIRWIDEEIMMMIVKYDEPMLYKFSAEEYSMIMLASDGLRSFKNPSDPQHSVPPADVIEAFTKFDNPKGDFVQRRARQAIKRYEKQSIVNTGDVSMGAIYL